jgi:hypothetical protein
MRTVEYTPALDPLLELSLPAGWIDAVVLEPGYLLVDSDRLDDQLFGQALSGGQDGPPVVTRLAWLYYRGINPDKGPLSGDNQISVSYDPENEQYELSSAVAETTAQTADSAINWATDQFRAVETFVTTYSLLIGIADDIHGLGPEGVRGLAETFEGPDAMQEADIDTLATVPYVDEQNGEALQTALGEIETVRESESTSFEEMLQNVDGPLILDLQDGPIPGKLVPSGASEPTYVSERFDGVGLER